MFILLRAYVKNTTLMLIMIFLASCATTRETTDNSLPQDIEIREEYGVDDDINSKFEQAVELIKQEQYKDAIVLLEEVTDQSKKHSAPYVNLGIAYLKLGKIEESEESLLKALKINPDHPVTNNELGMVYRKSGRFKEAKKVYEYVLTKYPFFLPARKNIGILCDLFMKDLVCAIEHYEAYLKIKTGDKNVKIWLKDLKQRAGVK